MRQQNCYHSILLAEMVLVLTSSGATLWPQQHNTTLATSRVSITTRPYEAIWMYSVTRRGMVLLKFLSCIIHNVSYSRSCLFQTDGGMLRLTSIRVCLCQHFLDQHSYLFYTIFKMVLGHWIGLGCLNKLHFPDDAQYKIVYFWNYTCNPKFKVFMWNAVCLNLYILFKHSWLFIQT